MLSSVLMVAVASWAVPRGYAQVTIQQILTNGPTDKRLNIVFLSEGYTTGELSKYLNTDVYRNAATA